MLNAGDATRSQTGTHLSHLADAISFSQTVSLSVVVCWLLSEELTRDAEVPKQENGYDCGVCVCRYAKAVLNVGGAAATGPIALDSLSSG